MRQNERLGDVSALSTNQLKALNALLSTTSIENAAKQCGLGTSTIRRYLMDDEFKRTYRQHRTILLSETVTGISQLGTKAIAVVADAIEDENDKAGQLRAARLVLDYVAKLVELERRVIENEELEARLSSLEAERDAQRTNGNGWRGR